MGKYLVLIYGDEQRWDAETAEERRAKDTGHAAFRDAAGEGMLRGHELFESSAAVTLRSQSDGRAVRMDGPFAETKEVVGGFYVLEAPSLEAAVALAGGLPELGSGHGGVEVRPIVER